MAPAHLPPAGRVTAARPAAAAASPSDRGSRALRWSVFAVFVGAVAVFFVLGGPEWLSLETIKQHRDALVAYADAHYAAALAIGFLVYAGATALSLPGGLVLSLTMGFVFGRFVGTTLVVVAATVGATLLFLAARYLFAERARKRLGAWGERINAGFTRNAFSYLLFLRLAPAFPFFLVNLAPAFTTMPLRTYVLATFIGIIPGSFVFVNLGQALGRIDSVQGLLSPELLGGLALLALFALIPPVVQRLRARRKKPL